MTKIWHFNDKKCDKLARKICRHMAENKVFTLFCQYSILPYSITMLVYIFFTNVSCLVCTAYMSVWQTILSQTIRNSVLFRLGKMSWRSAKWNWQYNMYNKYLLMSIKRKSWKVLKLNWCLSFSLPYSKTTVGCPCHFERRSSFAGLMMQRKSFEFFYSIDSVEKTMLV